MQASRWVTFAERVCLTVFCVWLLWLPLPFGSVVSNARLPLVAVPLALCTAASLLRLYATRDRTNTAQPTRAWTIFGIGALLFLAAGALQLVPLPPGVVGALSPDAHAIWSGASRVAALAGETVRTSWPLSVAPRATAAELLRLAALFATFTTAALLVRSHARRRTLAVVLCAGATFEALYGLRQAALQKYEIWGWVNRLVFHRVTGTFVNPNHFAHYIAIILPLALFLGAALWHKSGTPDLPVPTRIALLIERHILLAGFAILAAVACLSGMLLAQSRGALLALAAGLVGVAALLPGRRLARMVFASIAGLALVAALAIFLGPERTVGRFAEVGEQAGGRRDTIAAALRLWQRFSIAGSGHGTFQTVVSMEQDRDLGRIYNHAHNDYAELAATSGTLGLVIALVTLLGGAVALARMTFGRGARELTWVRRAYQTAALASLAIAAVHALFDFNFFIPANPATLAAIVGAAVASVDHDKRTRR
ncbi:MAG TPA: O-antigen ligase family protein [Thermoanaerobaculia bacterium]|nr:O-antigen ligase family protein [Thermoanaerobaculia bacterium]